MLNAQKMAPFITSFIKSRLLFEESFVLEGDCITPNVVKYFKNNTQIQSLFLGYPNISVEEKLQQLLRDREGWTKDRTNDDLRKKIKIFIDDSKIFQRLCAETNLPFIDTSKLSLDETISASLGALHF